MDTVLPVRKGSGKGRKKKGNKHKTNLRRIERKYGRPRKGATPGKCGSSYCSKSTGCEPWK